MVTTKRREAGTGFPPRVRGGDGGELNSFRVILEHVFQAV